MDEGWICMWTRVESANNVNWWPQAATHWTRLNRPHLFSGQFSIWIVFTVRHLFLSKSVNCCISMNSFCVSCTRTIPWHCVDSNVGSRLLLLLLRAVNFRESLLLASNGFPFLVHSDWGGASRCIRFQWKIGEPKNKILINFGSRFNWV